MVARSLAALLLTGLCAVTSAAGAASAAEPQSSSKCAGVEHRRLDFWIGDWDVYEIGGPEAPVARARIDAILDGCTLREVYEQSDGLAGQSFSTYDASRKLWHQTWVTNRGALLQIDGRFEGKSLTLKGPRLAADGRKEIVRGVWTPEEGGVVRELAHTSTDGGKTWQHWFDVRFRRHEDKIEKAAGTGAPDADSIMRTITRLNQEYVDAFLKSDVAWYRDHLADDFVCIVGDGSVLDRDAFLRDTAGGPGVKSYALKDVRVRSYGSFAVVNATGEFTRLDGTIGTSRYTDVWGLQDGKWKTVSAQITRIPAPEK
jgi:ketosteroid isomerase-like protein